MLAEIAEERADYVFAIWCSLPSRLAARSGLPDVWAMPCRMLQRQARGVSWCLVRICVAQWSLSTFSVGTLVPQERIRNAQWRRLQLYTVAFLLDDRDEPIPVVLRRCGRGFRGSSSEHFS